MTKERNKIFQNTSKNIFYRRGYSGKKVGEKQDKWQINVRKKRARRGNKGQTDQDKMKT